MLKGYIKRDCPLPYIDTTTTASNINGLYSTQSFNRSQYPIIKADFKTDNTNSGASVSTEGSIENENQEYNDSSYRSLGVVFDSGNIKVKITIAGIVAYPIVAITNAQINTYYTVEFEFFPTDTKVYVYRQGDPRPAIPAYTYTETGWDPNLIFTNYQGNTYIDNVGIKTVQDADNYVYDNLNRLTQVKDAENEVQIAYTYDEQGNRLTKAGLTGTTNYTYDAANQLLSSSVNGQPSTTYTYDQNGNTVKKVTLTDDRLPTTEYTYDNKNQLVGVRSSVNGQPSATIEYTYDGNGNRYSKTVNGQTRYYSYDTSGNIVSEYKRVMVNGVEKSQTLVRYVRDNAGKAISIIQGANTYYFIYNGHGDVTALTDSTGTVVATYSYDEFGNLTSSTGNIYNPLRYSGAHNAYYDSETASASSAQDGLYKMGARYYQSDVGRWLTRDSYKGEQQQLQTNNRYAYVENNPISKVDPTGFKAWSSSRKINASDRSAYRQFIKNNYQNYLGKKFGKPDCADLALRMLVDFAAQRKVSLELKSFGGSFNSDNYNSKERYYEAAWKNIGAEAVAKLNSKKLKYYWKYIQPGDLLMLNNPSWDTKIVWGKSKDGGGLYYNLIHQNPGTTAYTESYYVKEIKPRLYQSRPRRWNWQ